MSDDPEGFNLQDALENGAKQVRETFTTIFGTQREAFVCPHCSEACEQTYTHDPHQAAFDGGESPAWHCESCDRHFVRERGDEQYGLDLYGRSPPE